MVVLEQGVLVLGSFSSKLANDKLIEVLGAVNPP
jgi:hypothetical protein